MNRVALMGRLVRDPEIRYTQGDNSLAIARYALAVDRRGAKKEGQQNADFIRCVAFGQRAEFAEHYMHQGRRFAVTGSIQTGSYQDKNGNTVYTTEVLVDSQEFADGKESGEPRQTEKKAVGAAGDDGFMQIPDGVDDVGLPFN